MRWFRVDPAAEAIIKSLEEQPERWHKYGENWILLDTKSWSDAKVRLWRGLGNAVRVNKPAIDISHRSERALSRAIRSHISGSVLSEEQQNREDLVVALQVDPEAKP